MSSNVSYSSVLEPELYFLIARFLSRGPCQKAAKALLEEVEEFKLLPQRVDWEGNEHFRSYENLCYLNRHIRSDHLLRVVERVGTLLDKELKPSVLGVKSLLGAGSLSLLRTAEDRRKTRWGFPQHIVRQHGAPTFPPSNLTVPSLSHMVRSYETSGVVRPHHIIPANIYHKVAMHGRKLGHLSAVYCVLFDHAGKYIFTGADDGLVKIWSTHNMRLLATLRGHSAEITDMAVSFDNRYLASGSCDKVVRVWCLFSKAPAAVLQAHSAMITSVQFCPKPQGDYRYLVSTGTDGCVCFWNWNIHTNEFGAKPMKFVERSRAGAQMLCSSFSPGGVFLATGNSDHVVRVYFLHAAGIDKICELEAHTDKVDSICYSNHLNRFVSGSNDGTARIWRYEAQQWRATVLNMNARIHGSSASESTQADTQDLRVTMINWSMDDSMVVTAASDLTIKIWNAYTGTLLRVLEGHDDEVFVLETCPTDSRILLSAGHDGNMILWDIYTGTKIKKFFNLIEGQGHGAVFDCKFSPDGHTLAATDSHGHLLLMGFGQNDRCKKIPQQLFFHTDYRPLVRDHNNFVLDEQTQQPPHLMPPPFLVDIDGNPYPPSVQRLVPGRENYSDANLIPAVAVNADGDHEVIGDREQEDREGPGGNQPEDNSDTEEDEPNRNGEVAGGAGPAPVGAARPSIDAMIQQLQRQQDNQLRQERSSGGAASNAGDHNYIQNLGQSLASPPGLRAGMQNRIGMRRSGEVEGVRQSLGNVAVQATKKERDAFRKQVTVKPLDPPVFTAAEERRSAHAEEELKSFWAERKKKLLSPSDISTASILINKKRSEKQKKTGTRRRNQEDDDLPENVETARNRLTTRALYDTEEEEDAATDVDMWQSENNSSDDYSDWVGDEASTNLEPPKRRSKRKPKRRRLTSSEEEEEIDVEEEVEEVDTIGSTTEEDTSDEEKEEDREEASSSPVKRERSQRIAQARSQRKTMRRNLKRKKIAERRPPLQAVDPNTSPVPGSSRTSNKRTLPVMTELDERFRPPDWITTTIPRKAPFVPQMGDEVLYFRQGHEHYLNAVVRKEAYPVVADRNQPWHKIPNLRAQELVKIVGIKWQVLPPRLCCLKLAFLDNITGKLTGKSFTIRYHDMPDVIDFIVLKHHYDISVERKWRPGCRFRSMIDDQWWLGTIKTQEPLDPDFPDSLYQCFNVHWDNGEYEKLSPWDMEPIDPKRKPAEVGGGVDVTQDEYKSLLYVPKKTEWPGIGRDADTGRLVEGIGTLMQHSLAEPFSVPVDLQQFPVYAAMIPYPIDLSTIKTRLENGFYRRITALQWDVRLIASNANDFNEAGSKIVNDANTLTETLLRFIKDVDCDDPMPIMSSLTHEDLKSGSSEEEETESGSPEKRHISSPSQSHYKGKGRSRRRRKSACSPAMSSSSRHNRSAESDSGGAHNTNAWLEHSQSLLAMLFECEDSEPFRLPVDPTIYTDYQDIVSNPMDLTTVHTKLESGHYASPLEMCRDIRLIFQNSKRYNTNKRSRIYSMTLRLSALFEAQIKGVLSQYKSSHRLSSHPVRVSRTSRRHTSPPPTPSLGWDILTNTLMDPSQPSTSGLKSQTASTSRGHRSHHHQPASASTSNYSISNPTTSLSVITSDLVEPSTSAESLSGSSRSSGGGASRASKVSPTTSQQPSTSGSKAGSGNSSKVSGDVKSTLIGHNTVNGVNGKDSADDSDATIVDDDVVDTAQTLHNEGHTGSRTRRNDQSDYEEEEEEEKEHLSDDDYRPSSNNNQRGQAVSRKGKSLIHGGKNSKGKASTKSSSTLGKSLFTSDGNTNESDSCNEDGRLASKRSRKATNKLDSEEEDDDEEENESDKYRRLKKSITNSRSLAPRNSSRKRNANQSVHSDDDDDDNHDSPVHRKVRVGRSARLANGTNNGGRVRSSSRISPRRSAAPSSRPRSAKQRKTYFRSDSDATEEEEEEEEEDDGVSSEVEESSEKASEDSEDELITQSKRNASSKASKSKKHGAKSRTTGCVGRRRKHKISSEDDDDDDSNDDDEEEEESDSVSHPKRRSRQVVSSPPKKRPRRSPQSKTQKNSGKSNGSSRSRKSNGASSNRETRNRGQQRVTYLDYDSDDYGEEDDEENDSDNRDSESDDDSEEESSRVVKTSSVSSRGRVRKLTARAAQASLRVH